MHDQDADPQLLSIAGSISDRERVNWDDLKREVPADQAAIVEQLRFVESVARLGEDTPDTWGPYAIVGEIGRGALHRVPRLRFRAASGSRTEGASPGYTRARRSIPSGRSTKRAGSRA